MSVVSSISMDLSSILVWNVRGLNNKARRDVVRDTIASTRPEIVCLQETEIKNMTSRVLLTTLGASLDRHAVLPANGTRGSVLVAWNSTSCHNHTPGRRVLDLSSFPKPLGTPMVVHDRLWAAG